MIALPRTSRDAAIVIFRDGVVERVGEFGPGIRLSTSSALPVAGVPTPAERAESIIQTAAGTPKPIDAFTRTLTRVTGLERMTAATYGMGARLLLRLVAGGSQAA